MSFAPPTIADYLLRNPFSYHPWSADRSFQKMFDTLEADIVCFQELKIQKENLTDDMVLVPGWDSYFTFPKHRKGGFCSFSKSQILLIIP